MKLTVLETKKSDFNDSYLVKLGFETAGLGPMGIGAKKEAYWTTASSQVPVGEELDIDMTLFNKVPKSHTVVVDGVEEVRSFVALELAE